MMNNDNVNFEITCDKGLFNIKTDNPNFTNYNREGVNLLSLYSAMANASTDINNSSQYGVTFTIG